MIILKKQKDPSNEFDTSEVTLVTHAVTLDEILEDVKSFLLACGYPINWNAELVIQESEDD